MPGHKLNQCWNIVISDLGTHFSELPSKIHAFSFKKMHLKMSSAKWRQFCVGLSVLNLIITEFSSLVGLTRCPRVDDDRISQTGGLIWRLSMLRITSELYGIGFNTLRPRQNGRYFPGNIFKWISLNENVWVSINISLKFVPRGPFNNIPTLVQVMAWRRPGDKPLSEPMIVR